MIGFLTEGYEAHDKPELLERLTEDQHKVRGPRASCGPYPSAVA